MTRRARIRPSDVGDSRMAAIDAAMRRARPTSTIGGFDRRDDLTEENA